MSMTVTEREVLRAELQKCHAELAAVKTAKAALAAQCYSGEESKLEGYASEIRSLSHSTATLKAQCDMSSAHLKALTAMTKSTASQVRSRQTLLQTLLRQTEDIEASKHETKPVLEYEDEEEQNLKQRLHDLSLSCKKLKEKVGVEALEFTTTVHSEAELLTLSDEAQRISSEITSLREASAVLEEMPEPPTDLSKLRRLRLPGSSLASLEALLSQVQELATVEEDMRRCNREKKLQHLRQEVVERQRHFSRMTHDLQAQVLRLEEEVNGNLDRRNSTSDLRALELLRQRELRQLRDQEEQLEQMERQDLSLPPGPMVDPGAVNDSARERPTSSVRLSLAREVQRPRPKVQEVQETSESSAVPELGPPSLRGIPSPGSRFALPEVYRRHSNFEERVSELQAVIGTSLQSLAEEGWLSSDSGVHSQ